jgi:eukaryotic-like serine/threonine-protein kinase
MTGVVHCPNPACGHPSRLSIDPPGRVFRCRRCQAKLRTGAVVREPVAVSVPTDGDPGRSSTFDDDLGDWLDGPSDRSSIPDCRDLLSSIPDREAPSGTSGPGRLGRYRVLDPIGEGRYARVYRGFDPVLERAVALKVPRPGMLAVGKMQERFLGEARTLARLRHPAIVPIFEMGRDADRCFIAMGLVEGPSLADLGARGPAAIDHRRTAEIVADLADALDYAHGQGVLHRDVKPANILTDDSGSVFLTDFGLACRPDSGEVAAGPERVIGTPAYIAPEQAASPQPRSLPAGDQYSLGVVFYQLLCGRTPFSGTPMHVLYQAMSQEPPSPRSIDRAVPTPLAAICMKAMAKRPEDRYPRCAEFSQALRRWCRAGRG